MKRTIVISQFKNISHLSFDIPKSGVFLLTGSNGCGKSTLLSALTRIGDHRAFPRLFPSSKLSAAIDSAKGAAISFHQGSEVVTYKFTEKGRKWTASPREKSRLLDGKLGFASVSFFGANAERITPTQQDIEIKKHTLVKAGIRAQMNLIFNSNRFDNLRQMHLKTTHQDPAHLIPLKNETKTLSKQPALSAKNSSKASKNSKDQKEISYFVTEKNFSLGELCVLKLLRGLDSCMPNALVLIDELELALHPQAQAQLYRHLVNVAAEKDLTIIFSTHSASLIRASNPQNIYYLEPENAGLWKQVGVRKNCFPAFILGNLGEDSIPPDAVFFVEDQPASLIFQRILTEIVEVKFKDSFERPTCKVVPIGGWDNVIRFLPRSRQLFSGASKIYAVLDADAKPALSEALETNAELQDIDRQYRSDIHFLPFTPEVGLVNFLGDYQNQKDLLDRLKEHFGDARIALPTQEINNCATEAGASRESRNRCKSTVLAIISCVNKNLNRRTEEIEHVIFTFYASLYFQQNKDLLMQKFGCLLRRSA